MGQSVDDQRATQNAARVLFEQGDQLGDDVNVGPGRHTRKRLDVSEVSDGTFILTLHGELRSDALASLSQNGSLVDVNAVLTGFQTIDGTTDLDGAGDRGLFQENLALDIDTLEGDDGTTRTLHRFSGAKSDGNNEEDSEKSHLERTRSGQ